MPGLVPGIHAAPPYVDALAWIAGTSPAMTVVDEGSTSFLLRHDQILPLVDARVLAGVDHGGAIELVKDRGPRHCETDVEFLALVHRALHIGAVETHTPLFAQRVGERGAGAREAWHLHRGHEAEAAHT